MSGQISQKGLREWGDHDSGRDLQAYGLVLLESGTGIYDDEAGFQQEIYAGDIILLFPGLCHRYGRRKEDTHWDEIYLVFNDALFASLEHSELLNRSLPIWYSHNNPDFVAHLVELHRRHQSGLDQQQPHQTLLSLHQLLVKAHSLHHGGEHRHQGWIEKASQLLAEDLQAQTSMEEFSRRLNCSEQLFRKRFRNETGTSPYQFRLQKRLEQARNLLLEQKQNLEYIASQCGFCDAYHFSKIFKKHLGLNPGQFRSQHGQSPKGSR